MEFPEAGRNSARKFLEYFLNRQQPPPTSPDEEWESPVSSNWSTVSEEEAEGECMDIARNLLCKSSCPGFLTYNIAAAAVGKVFSESLDAFRLPPVAEDEEAKANGEQASDKQQVSSASKDPPKQMLDGKLLTRAVVAAVHHVCKEWTENLPSLTCPRQRFDISIYSAKNGRRKMEDRHSICMDINTLYGLKDCPDQVYIGVYDGHVGVEAATYSAVHLYHNIARHPQFVTDPTLAIKESVRVTDERCCQKNWRSGSTAVLALIRGDKLYVGWVGDSQAALFKKGGEDVQLVQPHKPENEDEEKRIQDAGGLVLYVPIARVNGTLSVSRAIGDAKDKKYIIGEADVVTHTLDGTEEYLVLACDGVWDVVNNNEMRDCVNKHFLSGGKKQMLAKAICDFARNEGSSDNLTAIVVFFDGFQLPQPPKEAENSKQEKTDGKDDSQKGELEVSEHSSSAEGTT